MIFELRDERKPIKKFAWLPVCVDENRRIWIWLESYMETVIGRYGIGGVTYYRQSKRWSGVASGIFG